jgi:hypothetical protein
VGLDVAWGIFRTITIQPARLREVDVTWSAPELGDELVERRTSCPPATEIVLRGGTERLAVQIAADGAVDVRQRSALRAFLGRHAAVQPGGDFRLDTSCRGAEWWQVRPIGGWRVNIAGGKEFLRCPP